MTVAVVISLGTAVVKAPAKAPILTAVPAMFTTTVEAVVSVSMLNVSAVNLFSFIEDWVMSAHILSLLAVPEV